MPIYRLKIVLLDVTPQVWRRVEVESGTPLPELSCVLLDVMGWDDSHLHQFVVGKTAYGMPNPDFPIGSLLDENQFTLRQIAPHAKNGLRFEYDFGDGWEHRVTVEAIMDAVAGVSYPRCIGGANACPPEDCGGSYGYGNLLRVVADPKHINHEEMREWLGDSFDPAAFDLERTNVRLRNTGTENERVITGHENEEEANFGNASAQGADCASGDSQF